MNESFKTLLNIIKYPLNDEIKNGKAINPVFNRETSTLSFQIVFPTVISPNALVDLNWHLLEGLVKAHLAGHIDISYKFENESIDNILLKAYYNYVL